jgi:hypothetical protein
MKNRRGALALAVGLLALTATACGSESRAQGTAIDSTVAATTSIPATAYVCVITDPAVLSAALGYEAVPIAGTCGFAAGPFDVSVETFAYDPDGTGSGPDYTKGTIPPSAPRLDGIKLPHTGRVSMNRGGGYQGDVTVVDGATVFDVTVMNHSSGSDTYSPTDGPPQKGPTEAAVVAVANAITAHR